MGRRKIQITPIQDDRNRNVTFGKRRNGLFKKAYELGVLCSVDVAILVWGHNGKLFAFSSQGSLKGMIDRYHRSPPNDNDVIGPVHYGGDLTDLAAMKAAASGMDGLKDHVKGGHKSKRRRSDDDSDDDDDDDGDDDGLDMLGSNSSQHNQIPPGQMSSSVPTHLPSHMSQDPSMYPNGIPSHHIPSDLQRYGLPQPPPSMHPHAHPYFGAYPYPGYPHHLPNVNPALGNPMGFYGPSAAAAMAAAAAAGGPGNYNYAGLPPHLLRAAAAHQYHQDATGGSASSNSTPPAGATGGGSNGQPAHGFTPIRSPAAMDSSHHQQQHQSHAESSNSYSGQHSSSSQQQQQQLHHPGSSPQSGSARKPALHLDFGSNNSSGTSAPAPNGVNEQHSHSNGIDMRQYSQSTQQGAGAGDGRRDSYSEHNGMQASTSGNNNPQNSSSNLGVPGGIPFPDYGLTSPSQLFPEIYRSMNAYAESQATRAMTFGAENTPGVEDDDGNDPLRNIFRWPTLSGSGSTSNNNNNNHINCNAATGSGGGNSNMGSNSNTPHLSNSTHPQPPQRQGSTGSNFSTNGMLDAVANSSSNNIRGSGGNNNSGLSTEADLLSRLKREAEHDTDARMG